jgi:hypothetical protein
MSLSELAVKTLHEKIFSYNTFHSMHNSLLWTHATPVLHLLQSCFAEFLDDVQPCMEEPLADFLIAEGVLVKPNPSVPSYCMSSPFVDGFI